jgi:hypothetical protein
MGSSGALLQPQAHQEAGMAFYCHALHWASFLVGTCKLVFCTMANRPVFFLAAAPRLARGMSLPATCDPLPELRQRFAWNSSAFGVAYSSNIICNIFILQRRSTLGPLV